uniref:Uncharacterized protein n=1 Tax=Rhizophora mucronata TaxID=61149 RepID=A0A2P2PV23_RHIMU
MRLLPMLSAYRLKSPTTSYLQLFRLRCHSQLQAVFLCMHVTKSITSSLICSCVL